jgi:hypothetical protein
MAGQVQNMGVRKNLRSNKLNQFYLNKDIKLQKFVLELARIYNQEGSEGSEKLTKLRSPKEISSN